MENYNELIALKMKSNEIKRVSEIIPSIAMHGLHADYLSTGKGNITFRDLRNLIGKERMDYLIEQFKLSLELEVHKLRVENDKELAKFEVIKKG